MPFQNTLHTDPAPGIEGDWCSANPRHSLLAPVGQLTSGQLGVTVGRFAWADANGVVNNSPPAVGGRIGFVHKDQPALITTWLAESTMLVPAGLPVTVHDRADVWCRFAAGATIGQKVYANYADGTAVAHATGSADQWTSTASSIAEETSSFTATFSGSQMTVSAVASGTLYRGSVLSGGAIISGTTILSQLSGTQGGVGVYEVSVPQNIETALTVTGEYGLMTWGGTTSGTPGVGDVISGSGVTSGSVISDLGIGSDAGKFVVPYQTVGSEAIDATTNVETAWYVDSNCNSNELAMISQH